LTFSSQPDGGEGILGAQDVLMSGWSVLSCGVLWATSMCSLGMGIDGHKVSWIEQCKPRHRARLLSVLISGSALTCPLPVLVVALDFLLFALLCGQVLSKLLATLRRV
jgi:hypothetical protein